MEYVETPDGQIQADFERRVGQVLLHYEADSGVERFISKTLVCHFPRWYVAAQVVNNTLSDIL